MRDVQSLRDLEGKSVLVRIDTDVDLDGKKVTDDSRLRAALPTIRYLVGEGATVTLTGHMGRPKGKVAKELSLEPVAHQLAHLLIPHHTVHAEEAKSESPVFEKQYRIAKNVTLLENLRFDPGEEANEAEFISLLAKGHDYYVNESFATAHRKAASTVGIAKKLPAVAGLRLIDELAHLDIVKHSPKEPFTLIVGGAKAEEKLGLIEQFLPSVDAVLTGGVVANMLLAASGTDVRQSLIEPSLMDAAKRVLKHADSQIAMPLDYVWDGDRIADIGRETIELYTSIIEESETVFWAGDMGVAEIPAFAKGTKAVAEAIAAPHEGVRMVGGGDTAAALKELGLLKKIDFVSTGGGAALEYLAGKKLPGLEVLN